MIHQPGYPNQSERANSNQGWAQNSRDSSQQPSSVGLPRVSVLELVPPSTSSSQRRESQASESQPARQNRTSPPDVNRTGTPATTDSSEQTGLKWVAVSPSRNRTGERLHSRTNGGASAGQSRDRYAAVPLLDSRWQNAPRGSQTDQNNTFPQSRWKSASGNTPATLASAQTGTPESPSIPTHSATSDRQMEQRLKTASKISLANLRHRPTGNAAVPPPADAPEGWHRVEDTLTQHLRQCDSLVKRRAYYSARDEALKAARYLVALIDEWAGTHECAPSLGAALLALDEAEQFGNLDQIATASVRALIESHSTPALHGVQVDTIAPLVAAKHYRVFATDALVYASLEHPWMSQIYYTLGRIYQAQADSASPQDRSDLHWRAVAFYRAAAAVDPQNALALDQLGYVFLQLDNPTAAREALVSSLRVDGSLSALQNLVEASRRLGDEKTKAWALQNHSQLAAAKRGLHGRAYVHVPPQVFVQATPRVSRPTYPVAQPGVQMPPHGLPMTGQPIPSQMQGHPAPSQQIPGRVANIPGYPAR